MKRHGFLLILSFATLAMMVFSCRSAKEVVYLQDTYTEETQAIKNFQDIRIQPGDMLSIFVSHKEPTLSALFNPQGTSPTGSSTSLGQRLSGYTVDLEGNIDFPIVGRIKVAGLTRSELSTMISKKLDDDGLLKGAVVTVAYQNFNISVLGEVNHPGKFNVESDRVSLFDALAMAGDLTIYGRRDSVMVIRENNGQRQIMYNNLLSKDVLNSPSYFLQQNDVVYVKPNHVKAQQSGINQNNNVGVWLSAASLLTTILMFMFK
ncbi:MAG: polysaccharide export protein [Bacteroidales bacterium]|nr:polysaccharide export protein [Bacteroidales bacterium]